MTEEESLKIAARLQQIYPNTLKGRTSYMFKNGKTKEIEVEVCSYDYNIHKFHLINEELGISLHREKPLFTLEEDMKLGILNYAEAQKTKRDAIALRAESKQYLRVARLI
jgi:hypothetical protein